MSSGDCFRVAVRKFGPFESAIQKQYRSYQEATGSTLPLEFEALDLNPLYDSLFTRRGLLDGTWDVAFLNTDWLAEAVAAGALEDLSPYMQAAPIPDYPEGWSPSLIHFQHFGDAVYGVPYHDGPECFVYRRDLFGDPAEQRVFEERFGYALEVPRTWSQFYDLARFFTRPDDDLYGCVVAAKPDGHNDVYDFLIHLWSRGGVFLDAERRPAFASAEGEAALRFYTDLIHEQRVTQPEPWAYDSIAAGEFYASGRAAMMWNWCGFQTVADLPETSKIPGKTRSTLLPAGDGPEGRAVSLIVYWAMTIPAGCRNPDAAWAFMRHLATPAMDKVTALAGGSGTRLSTWNDAEVRRRFGYYETIEEVHRQARTLPAIPEYPAINEAIDRMMGRVVTGGQPVPDALREASEETEQILADAGYYRQAGR